MSLSVDGVWKVGTFDQTTWADGVWREGEAAVVTTIDGAASYVLNTNGQSTIIYSNGTNYFTIDSYYII